MQILAEEGIAEVFGKMFSELNDQTFAVVQLEPAGHDHNRSDIRGLDTTLTIAGEGFPVVMLGWLTPAMYIDRRPSEWFATTGYSNVIFLRLPATSEEVLAAIEEVKSGNRRSDPLAIALLGVAQTNTELGILHHDLSSAQRDADRMISWEKRARKVFGDKTQAELISLVMEIAPTRYSSGKFAGQKFPDVCIDVEGTILTSDGQIRSEVIALAEEKAKGGPITVWTGGDIHELSKQLLKAGVLYKIVSKETMRGVTVRVVIDNQPEATFKSERGIDCEEYIQV
jgi:hypothetical protein